MPVVNTTGTGRFSTRIPSPRLSLISYLWTRPDLWGKLNQADQVKVETDYFNATQIADVQGQVLTRVPADMEGVCIASVELPSAPPQPTHRQPKFGLSAWAYALDRFANLVLVRIYRANQG